MFFNNFHPMIWQEFKTEWGYFSWERSPLCQLTPLGPAGRAQIRCTERAPGCIGDPDAQLRLQQRRWDLSSPCLLPSAPLLLSDFTSRGADFTPHPAKTSGKPSASWAAPQLGRSYWQHFDGTRLLQAESNKINLQEIQERWFPSMELPHLLKLACAQCTHYVSCQPGFRQPLRGGQGIDLLHRTKSLSSSSISWTLSSFLVLLRLVIHHRE